MANLGLPSRMFAKGSEPIGKRVHSYRDLSIINDISAVLVPSELEIIKSSQFGQLFAVLESAAYSGKLIHFLLTRQLVVKKDYEIWVIYGGFPIRFSIAEFAAVTGLRCDKLPTDKEKKGKRKTVVGKYWYKYFDRADVSADWLVSRLKRHLVPERDNRIRYAVLALLDGVLCPTSAKRKIVPLHVDMSDNLEDFLKYPWGTEAFKLTMHSIKVRGPQNLKKKSTTVQGFPLVLPLVLLQAVSQIKELQFLGPNDDNDSDMEEPTFIERLWILKLDVVWKVDGKAACTVDSLLGLQLGHVIEDTPDEGVDRLMDMINDNCNFTDSMFVCGKNSDDHRVDKTDSSDICSTDATNCEGVERGIPNEPQTGSKGKRKAIDHLSEGLKQYVETKVKRSEKRVMTAIADSEVRISDMITLAIQKNSSGHVGHKEDKPGKVDTASDLVRVPNTSSYPVETVPIVSATVGSGMPVPGTVGNCSSANQHANIHGNHKGSTAATGHMVTDVDRLHDESKADTFPPNKGYEGYKLPDESKATKASTADTLPPTKVFLHENPPV